MQIQPELFGWSKILQFIKTETEYLQDIYNKSEIFQLLLWNHLMLMHSASDRKYIRDFNVRSHKHEKIVET